MALAWLIVRPLLFAIVTYRTLSVLELSVARYMSGVWHPVAGSLAMAAIVMTVNLYLGSMSSVGRLVVCSLVGCLAYAAYNVLFNSAALHEVKKTLLMRTPGRPLRLSEERYRLRRPQATQER